MGDIADQECQRGRTNERRGGDPTNLEASETKIEQVHRQQDADETIGEGAHAAREEEDCRVGSVEAAVSPI